jgi:type VI secretion system secreted protein VgrG
MASNPTTRLTRMTIDVGEQVELERITSSEGLSRPFSIEADIVSPLEIDIQPHLGKPTALTVLEDSEIQRYFHGLIISAEYLKETPSGHHYRVTLEPWTYFLDQNRDMAIFQDLKTVDIIKQVFEAAGISDVDYSKLSKPRVPRDYCVQYGESDFAFVSRLMEEEGIYYYFQHSADKHVMMLCEGPSCHQPGKPQQLRYNQNAISVFASDSAQRFTSQVSFLQSWKERVSTTARNKVTYRDFDFQSPDQPLIATQTAEATHPRDDREVYHYPGRYRREYTGRGDQTSAGEARSQTVLDGARADRRVFTGTAQASALSCGALVDVAEHPAARMNGSYMITATRHSIAAETYRSGERESEEDYNIEFEAIPAATTYQPPQTTERPVVHGLESAIVTGPAGETIYTDEYGRVKVRFHWDRKDTPGEKSTCWMRISQTGGLGNLILPRVGHEVLIDFLNGNPDRPLVVGRVFNQSNMPIYDLPANKTRALWRTLRYGETGQYPDTMPLDTGAPGVNEIRLEDKGGSEEFFVHAERLMNTRVRFDETHHVGHNQDHKVGYDRTAFVGNDETKAVVHDRNHTIGNDENVAVGNNRVHTVKINDTQVVGEKLEIVAGTSIQLSVGTSTIYIDGTSITLNADNIQVIGNQKTYVYGTDTKVEASTTATLKGAVTYINPT